MDIVDDPHKTPSVVKSQWELLNSNSLSGATGVESCYMSSVKIQSDESQTWLKEDSSIGVEQ